MHTHAYNCAKIFGIQRSDYRYALDITNLKWWNNKTTKLLMEFVYQCTSKGKWGNRLNIKQNVVTKSE